MTTGEVEANLNGHRNWVSSVAFSQDGSRVVSGSYDKTVRIWDVTNRTVEAVLEGHRDSVRSVAFSQDGNRVVSGSDDKTVRIWNAKTGEEKAQLEDHTSWVLSVAFSDDGSQVVSGSKDMTVRIWNLSTGKSQVVTTPVIVLPDSTRVYRTPNGMFHVAYPVQGPMLSISDDGQWIVGALRDCWIPSHNSDFVSAAFSSNRVCFGYESGRVVIVDMAVTP
jgi:WD40 repeat protein